jgi:SP family facilitated glucose transporter-like MFS transporter 3
VSVIDLTYCTFEIIFLKRQHLPICRINAVFYYSGLFFDGVIDNPLVGTTLMGAVNVLATAAALLLMDRCGRRTLIMWSSAGMFLSCILIVFALLNVFSKTVAIAGVASYVTFFEIGLGPIPVSILLVVNTNLLT